jgi:hypothetical protein
MRRVLALGCVLACLATLVGCGDGRGDHGGGGGNESPSSTGDFSPATGDAGPGSEAVVSPAGDGGGAAGDAGSADGDAGNTPSTPDAASSVGPDGGPAVATDGDGGTGFTVAVTLQTDHAASMLVPTTGGTVTATGADGTAYQLVVPPDALLEATTITLTPIAQVRQLGFGADGTTQVGVQCGPDGLFFYHPATLIIQPAAGSTLPIDKQIFVQWRGAGQNLNLVPPDPTSAEIHLYVQHFSGYAVVPAKGYNSDIEKARMEIAGNAEDVLASELSEYMMNERQRELLGQASEDSGALLAIWKGIAPVFEDEVLKPRLAVARQSCAYGLLAMQTLLGYARQQQLMGVEDTATPQVAALAPDVTDQCMLEEYQICRDNHVVTRMMRIRLQIERQAEILGYALGASSDFYDGYVKACLNFELDVDSTATEVGTSYTLVQTMQARSLKLAFPGSVAEWNNGQNGKLQGTGDFVSTDYTVTSNLSCVGTTAVTPAKSQFTVNDLTFNTDPRQQVYVGNPPQDNILDFTLKYWPTPNTSTFSVADLCGGTPPVPAMDNWWAVHAAVMQLTNNLRDATNSYTVVGWDVNLAPEIGRKTESYTATDGNIAQSVDFTFVLRHVPLPPPAKPTPPAPATP